MPIKVFVPKQELYDYKLEKFIYIEPTMLVMEHSLSSIHEWEKIYKKAFLDAEKPKTEEESIKYYECMTLNKDEVNENVYYGILPEDKKRINDYIEENQTATWFGEDSKPKTKGRILKQKPKTAEVIYWEMIALNIPFECKDWHLSSLLTLIRVCNDKNDPKKQKKMTAQERSALNKARRAKLGTKG